LKHYKEDPDIQRNLIVSIKEKNLYFVKAIYILQWNNPQQVTIKVLISSMRISKKTVFTYQLYDKVAASFW
jgi:hypothetical protein